MGWERRGAAEPLYYRKARGTDGRVRSTYLGRGPLADCIAAMDGTARATGRYHVEAVRLAEAVLDGAGEAVEALTAAVRVQLDGYMLGLGLRYHRGQWRRPRVGDKVDVSPPSTPAAQPRREPALVSRLPFLHVSPSKTSVALASNPPGAEPERVVKDPSDDSTHVCGHPVWCINGLTSQLLELQLMTSRAVADGDGYRGNPVFKAFEAAARAVVMSWGGTAIEPVYPDDRPGLDGRRHRGRIALGRALAAASPSGRADEAALVVAAVLDEAGQDGRAAVSGMMRRARTEMKWASATPLGRRVIDQYILAQAAAELAVGLADGSAPVRARCREAESPADGAGGTGLGLTGCAEGTEMSLLLEALGLDKAAWAGKDTRMTWKTNPTSAAAWERRTRKARRRLADAARLVRHARKAGLLSANNAPGAAVDASSPASDGGGAGEPDVMAALTAPAPLLPLRDSLAKEAAAERRRIDALRAAWPPPAKLRQAELHGYSVDGGSQAERIWDPFSYEPVPDKPRDILDPYWLLLGNPWWVLVGRHETPEEAEALLAEWAPEYVSEQPVLRLPLSDTDGGPGRASQSTPPVADQLLRLGRRITKETALNRTALP